MGNITPANNIQFISASSIFAGIKEELSSFDESDMLDEGIFFKWTTDILNKLGIGFYTEEIAIIPVDHYRVKLPKNFKTFYAAFRCDASFQDVSAKGRGVFERVTYYTDFVKEERTNQICSVSSDPCVKKYDAVTVEHYIDTQQKFTDFTNFRLLRLGNSAIREICEFHGLNQNANGNPDEISFSSNGYINTNFNSGYVYLFYYALPVDPKTCMPLIPDVESVKRGIESYIQYRAFRKMWLNNSAPDLERKVQFLKMEHEEIMGAAYVEATMPSFQSMRNKIKLNKSKLKEVYNKYKYAW
jgi:hypothetical protein